MINEDIPIHYYPPPIQVHDESPPICVLPHCNPHPQDINDQFETEEQQDNPRICSEVGCTPNIIPGRPAKDCVPPACYPPQHDHYDENEYSSDTQEGVDITIECNGNEHVMVESPPICVPPHCYPSNLPGHEHQALPNDNEDENQSPPICVPPRCNPHSTFEEDERGRFQEDRPFTIQTDQEREQEYLSAHPEIVTTQDVEVEEGDDDEDKPICMPPICVPPAKSAPFFPCGEGEQDN